MKRSSKRVRAVWIGLAVLVVAGVLFASLKSLAVKDIVTVHVASPQYQFIHPSVISNGRVVPVDDFQARAAFAGTVEKIFVHVGDKVSAGQLLVKMNDPFAPSRYTSATAALRGAEVGDENIRHSGSQEDRNNMQGDLWRSETEQADAQKQLSILQGLLKTGATSQGEVSNAEHRVAAASQNLETLRGRMTNRYSSSEFAASSARVADAKASVQTARGVLANANITSTIAGTVYSLPVTNSDFIPMGAELMRITDLSKVDVHAYVDEPDIGKLALDEPVTVTWEARPNKVWHGHIKQVPLTVSHLDTRIVGECIIAIENPDGSLLPNANVAVDITTSQPTRALTIPRGALRMEETESFAFRVVGGKLVKTKVQVGIVTTTLVQILSGLSEQDVVVVSSIPVRELEDGLSVKVAP